MGLKSRLLAGVRELEAAAVSDPAHILLGAVGDHVAIIQEALITLDGATISRSELATQRYGPSTAHAVLLYKQRRNIINYGYQTKADSIVGKMTMASLDEGLLQLERSINVKTIRCDFGG